MDTSRVGFKSPVISDLPTTDKRLSRRVRIAGLTMVHRHLPVPAHFPGRFSRSRLFSLQMYSISSVSGRRCVGKVTVHGLVYALGSSNVVFKIRIHTMVLVRNPSSKDSKDAVRRDIHVGR